MTRVLLILTAVAAAGLLLWAVWPALDPASEGPPPEPPPRPAPEPGREPPPPVTVVEPHPEPEGPTPTLSEVRAYLDLEKADEALLRLDRILREDAQNPEALELRARAHLELGMHRLAERDARSAVEQAGETAGRLELLAEALLLRAPDRAAEYLRKAIDLDPTRARPHALLARLSLRRGAPEEARDHARQALLLDPSERLAQSILDRLPR